jgi:hypothetical protein
MGYKLGAMYSLSVKVKKILTMNEHRGVAH